MGASIEYVVQSGDILGDVSADECDPVASARAYADLLRPALEAAFPEDEVTVCVERTSGGRTLRVHGDLSERREREIETRVREIAGDLWTRPDSWLVAV